MSSKPRLFIASSTEGRHIAEALHLNLEHDADVRTWKVVHWGINEAVLADLMNHLGDADFAVAVFTPDDQVEFQDCKKAAPRDNVVFEFGLFLGRLGTNRVFFLTVEGDQDIDGNPVKLPSNFGGITGLRYARDALGKNISLDVRRQATESAAAQVRNQIAQRGFDPLQPMYRSDQRDILIDFVSRLTHCTSTPHSMLQKATLNRIEQWTSEVEKWGKGEYEAAGDYCEMLLGVYKSAQGSIFSTSQPEYNSNWSTPFGKDLLNRQDGNGNALSTRVFIYQNRSDVKTEQSNHDDAERMTDIDIFRQHQRHRIRVLLYFNKEDNKFTFDPDLGKDFTIIDDGSAIGVTKQFGDRLRATWYFGDEERANRFMEYREALLKAAHEFKGDWPLKDED